MNPNDLLRRMAQLDLEIAAREVKIGPEQAVIDDLKRERGSIRSEIVQRAESLHNELGTRHLPFDEGKVSIKPSLDLDITDDRAFTQWIESNRPGLMRRSVNMTLARPLLESELQANPDFAIPGVRLIKNLRVTISLNKSAGHKKEDADG